MKLPIFALVCVVTVLFSGCASQPKRSCYDMTISLGYNGPQTQRICTKYPQTESKTMRKVS